MCDDDMVKQTATKLMTTNNFISSTPSPVRSQLEKLGSSSVSVKLLSVAIVLDLADLLRIIFLFFIAAQSSANDQFSKSPEVLNDNNNNLRVDGFYNLQVLWSYRVALCIE